MAMSVAYTGKKIWLHVEALRLGQQEKVCSYPI